MPARKPLRAPQESARPGRHAGRSSWPGELPGSPACLRPARPPSPPPPRPPRFRWRPPRSRGSATSRDRPCQGRLPFRHAVEPSRRRTARSCVDAERTLLPRRAAARRRQYRRSTGGRPLHLVRTGWRYRPRRAPRTIVGAEAPVGRGTPAMRWWWAPTGRQRCGPGARERTPPRDWNRGERTKWPESARPGASVDA